MQSNWILSSKINLKHILKKKSYLKLVYTNIYIILVNNMKIKKDEALNLSGIKMYISNTELSSQIITFCTTCKMDLIEFL